MNPSASSTSNWKVPELKACIDEKTDDNIFVPFIALTETWLGPHIADAQVYLPGYDLVRSDRKGRLGGGVLLYVSNCFPISDLDAFDDGTCQALSCTLTTLKLNIFVVYRPPNADISSFNEALNFIGLITDSLPHNFQTIMCGDFNFPHVDWNLGDVLGGLSTTSACNLINFSNSSMFSQYVPGPTRGNNILDLFFTDNPFMVINSSIKCTPLSDHNLVEMVLALNYVPVCPTTESCECIGFQGLDFAKADFNVLNQALGEVDWVKVFHDLNLDDMPLVFTNLLLAICKEIVPIRKIKRGKPRLVRGLRRKRRRLNKRIDHLISIQGNMEHVQQLQRKVYMITYDIGREIQRDLHQREVRIINKIKDDPKAFYGYAKKHSCVRDEISALSTPDGYVTDKESIANLFQDQFSSVFSDPDCPSIVQPDFPIPTISFPMGDDWLVIRDDEVQDALAELKPSSSPGPDGIPAIVLKRCSSTLVHPIKLLLTKSIEEKNVP